MLNCNDAESGGGASCVKNVALLRAATRKASESYTVYGGGHNGSLRAGEYWRRSWLLLVLQVFNVLQCDEATLFDGSDSCLQQVDVDGRFSQNSDDISSK